MPRGIPNPFSEEILELIKHMYTVDFLSLPQIVTVLETSHGIYTSHGVINRRLRAMNIPLRTKGRGNKQPLQESPSALQASSSTSPSTSTSTSIPLYLPQHIHEDICKQYSIAQLSLSNIAARYNSHPPIIRNILRHYNIPLRPIHLGRSVSDTRAHQAVQEAIKQGKLQRCPCSYQDPVTGIFCAKGPLNRSRRKVIVIAHHDDYNYPLQVRWLCHAHHRAWHQYNEPVPLDPANEEKLYPSRSRSRFLIEDENENENDNENENENNDTRPPFINPNTTE